MKAFLILIFLAFTVPAMAQSSAIDSLYIVTYSVGSSWDASKSPGEQAYFKEHSGRLSQLRKDGVIKLGARYSDKGMIVIKAANTVAAREIINADVAIQNKLFVADIQKFNLFYDGCVERPK